MLVTSCQSMVGFKEVVDWSLKEPVEVGQESTTLVPARFTVMAGRVETRVTTVSTLLARIGSMIPRSTLTELVIRPSIVGGWTRMLIIALSSSSKAGMLQRTSPLTKTQVPCVVLLETNIVPLGRVSVTVRL